MDIPRIVSSFQIESEIKGSHRSRVFNVVDRNSGTSYILKAVARSLLSGAAVHAVRREFEYLSRLHHPHIVRVIDFGTEEGFLWLVSEKVDGRPLSGRAVSTDRVIGWARVLLDALAYLHDRGIVHHDIKPANVLVDAEGNPASLRLIDLGLATSRYVRNAQESPRGTRGYLAPELISGAAIDHRIDLFAAGVMLKKLLRRPGSKMEEWLKRMTMRNPEKRFQHARAALAALLPGTDEETRLEPYLVQSLPWARCREAWGRAWRILSTERNPRVRISGVARDIEPFSVLLESSLKLKGTGVTSFRLGEGPPSIEDRRTILVYGDGPAGDFFRESALWREVSVVLFRSPDAPVERLPGRWEDLELRPYRPAEISDLLAALHPDLRLERGVVEELHDKTEGRSDEIAKILAEVLKERPSLEEFRQRLLFVQSTWKTVGDRRGREIPDVPFRVLSWCAGPLPLAWFSDDPEGLARWSREGMLRYVSVEGEASVAALFGAEPAELAPAEQVWLKERLARYEGDSTRLLEQFTSLSMRAGLVDLSRQYGRRVIRRYLRSRRWERALLWVEKLFPSALPLRIRLLLENGQVRKVRDLLGRIPDGKQKTRALGRLAFVEGRFHDCPPSAEVLVRLGRHDEAYDRAVSQLTGAVTIRRRAELSRVAGLASVYAGKPERAIGHLSESCRLWRALNDVHGYVPALNQLGMAFAGQRLFGKAARCYRHAASLALRAGDRKRSLGYLLNLAIVRLETGEIGKALAEFERCRVSFRLLGLPLEEGYATQNLANLWVKAGNGDRAERLLDGIEPWLAVSGTAELKLFQEILRADIASFRGNRREFLARVEAMDSGRAPAGYVVSINVLKAEAEFLRGDLDRATRSLERSGDQPLHRQCLRSEWERSRGVLSWREAEERYRRARESDPAAGHSFSLLVRLRFLGMVHVGTKRSALTFPADLAAEVKELRNRLEQSSPPELWGAIRSQIERWFGYEPKGEAGPAEKSRISSISQEGGEGISILLDIGRRMTGTESLERLLRTFLDEIIRLAEASRGGILLREAEVLRPRLFLGAPWEAESELPVDLSRSLAGRVMSENRPICIPEDWNAATDGKWGPSIAEQGLRGMIALPLRASGEPFGVVYLDRPAAVLYRESAELDLLQAVTDHLAILIKMKDDRDNLQKREERIQKLCLELQETNLKQQRRIAVLESVAGGPLPSVWEKHGIIGADPRLHRSLELAAKSAKADSRILLIGEAGTEKEPLVRAIIDLAERNGKPYLAIDCATVPEPLFESELFGYAAGAFTGAGERKAGLLEAAGDGTLYLDSVASLSLASQVKLLRVLQENRFRPIGALEELPLRARIIASVNEEPEQLMKKGLLRPDLYYRLSVAEVRLPPLRERKEDLPRLVRAFLDQLNRTSPHVPRKLTKIALERLVLYPWPGNLAELRHQLERAALLAEGDVIDVEQLSDPIRYPTRIFSGKARLPLSRVRAESERTLLRQTLKETKGNRNLAARQLGISRWTLYRKLKTFVG